jgi:hypothetical protein
LRAQRRIIGILVAASVVCLGAFSAMEGGQAAPRRPASSETLESKSFVVVSVTSRSGRKPPIARPRSVIVQLSLGLFGLGRPTLSWQANCNIHSYRLRVTARRLMPGKGTSTLMGCPEGPAREDSWLEDFFASNPRWRLRHGHLMLVAGERVMRLQQKARR